MHNFSNDNEQNRTREYCRRENWFRLCPVFGNLFCPTKSKFFATQFFTVAMRGNLLFVGQNKFPLTLGGFCLGSDASIAMKT